MSRSKYTPEQQINAFWNKVNKDGSIPAHVPHLGKCWEWIGFKNDAGYGLMNWPDRNHSERIHRISWTLVCGDIPDGLFVLHKCDNRACCNPKHLFLGTQMDNTQDMILKGRKPKEKQVKTCKLNNRQVNEIKERAMLGERQNKLAFEYGVSTALVCYIVHNKKRG